jgi:hypothetical protein
MNSCGEINFREIIILEKFIPEVDKTMTVQKPTFNKQDN